MTKLNVCINKLAALREDGLNGRPDLVKTAAKLEKYGAAGITITPGIDRNAVGNEELYALRNAVTSELCIEGCPGDNFVRFVRILHPDRVVLIPDRYSCDASGKGWDTKHNLGYLSEVMENFKVDGIHATLAVCPDIETIRYAAETGCGSVELNTEDYAIRFGGCKDEAIEHYYYAAKEAANAGLAVTAAHGLNIDNIGFIGTNIPEIQIFTVGHQFLCEALEAGMENAVKAYLNEL